MNANSPLQADGNPVLGDSLSNDEQPPDPGRTSFYREVGTASEFQPAPQGCLAGRHLDGGLQEVLPKTYVVVRTLELLVLDEKGVSRQLTSLSENHILSEPFRMDTCGAMLPAIPTELKEGKPLGDRN